MQTSWNCINHTLLPLWIKAAVRVIALAKQKMLSVKTTWAMNCEDKKQTALFRYL